MVHFYGENLPTILFARVNQDRTKASAFLLYRDQGKLKCEYYVTSQTFHDIAITAITNLSSALTFWQDVLFAAKGSVNIISDFDEKLKTSGIPTLLHEIKLKRSDRNLTRFKEIYLGLDYSTIRTSQIINHQSKLWLIDDGMQQLLQGNDTGRESFKNTIRIFTNQSVIFSRVIA